MSRCRVDQETGEFFEGELYNEDKKDGSKERDYHNSPFNKKPGHRKRPTRPRSGFSNRNNRPNFGNDDSSSGFN